LLGSCDATSNLTTILFRQNVSADAGVGELTHVYGRYSMSFCSGVMRTEGGLWQLFLQPGPRNSMTIFRSGVATLVLKSKNTNILQCCLLEIDEESDRKSLNQMSGSVARSSEEYRRDNHDNNRIENPVGNDN
jgi:hypothetical protein